MLVGLIFTCKGKCKRKIFAIMPPSVASGWKFFKIIHTMSVFDIVGCVSLPQTKIFTVMKRTFTLLIAVAMSCAAMAQSWDVLKREISFKTDGIRFEGDTVKTPVYGDPIRVQKKSYDGTIYYVLSPNLIGYDKKYVPSPILEEYRFGRRCYKGGCATISIGAPMAFVGGILMATAGKSTDQLLAGQVLLGVGCSLVSVSIPLLSFGDHMKREANWHYRMQK